MANITAAEAFELYKTDRFFKPLARRFGAGFYKFLENFDAETGVLNATISATGLAGTTAGTFTVNSGAVTPSVAISVGASTGDYTQTWLVPTIAADRTITFPAVTGTLAILGANTFAGVQTYGAALAIGAGLTASGAVANTFAASTGTFITSTGANTLSGDVTIASGKTFTTSAGAVALLGAVTILGEIDTSAAAALVIGKATATALTLGASDITTTNAGPLTSTGILTASGALAVAGTATLSGAVILASTLDIRGAVSSSTGNPAFDMSGSGGLFKTTAGAVTIGSGAIGISGDVTVAANRNLSCSAGTTVIDLSLGTGIFKTTTGINTIGGATVFAANKGVTVAAGTSAFDFSGGTGAFKTTTGAVTIGNGAVAITGLTTFTSMPIIPTITKAGNLAVQATATALVTGFNLVTCADGSNTAVKLPTAVAGLVVIVKNGSAQTAKVFPNTDDAVNAVAANGSYDMTTLKAAMFVAYDATTWYTIPLVAS